MNRLYFVILALICVIFIIHDVRRKKFPIKESFWWMMASILMLLLAIFPYSINKLAEIFNVEYPPSLLFVFCILFLLLINLRNSKRISEQEMKIIELEQNLALLKDKVTKDE